MKDLDYGKGYKYAHDTEEKLTTMQTMPDSLIGREYYYPTTQGSEAKFKQRLEEISDGIKETANLSLNEYVLYIKIMTYGVN
ncbi:hypothetical protein [Bacillus velezensis]|uniref:AAA family ATPase n=1 Tax=Bacillus velezensis TaxID=492670 RepID=UPI001F0E6927|nr:hypothetical protein [Bacillus velezensis]